MPTQTIDVRVTGVTDDGPIIIEYQFDDSGDRVLMKDQDLYWRGSDSHEICLASEDEIGNFILAIKLAATTAKMKGDNPDD